MVKVINNISQPQKLKTLTSHGMNNKQTPLQQSEKHQNETSSEQMTFSHEQQECKFVIHYDRTAYKTVVVGYDS